MKNITANILLTVVSIALSLLLLEQSYRVYLYGGASFSIEKMNSIHPLGESGLIKPANNPEIIYELKPNLNNYFKLAEFITNSKGLRDKEYDLSKSAGVFRVAVVGDSFTLPAGVEIDEAFHSLLEEKLNKERRDVSYEFINFGVGGYDLRQYLAVIKFKTLAYDPDLIIVGFCPENDNEISMDKIFEQPFKVRPATSPFFHSHVLEALGIHVFGIKDKREKRVVETSSANKARYMNRMFSEMNAVSKSYNVPVVIVYLNTIYDEEIASEIERLVDDNGLYFLNASIPFKDAKAKDYAIYPTDNHPNGKAHRIFSEQIYGYLNKQELLGNTTARSD